MRRGSGLPIVTTLLCVWPIAVASAHDMAAPAWRGQGGTTHEEWRFSSGANPATPDALTNPYGTPVANITVGRYGSGWLNQIPGLGTQAGYWDLGGTNGRILIDLPNASSPARYTEVWVQVTYFKDITQPPIVNVPGGQLVSSQTLTVEHIATGGDWLLAQSVWRITPSPSAEQVDITTNPSWGAVIDQIVVDTICLPAPPCSDPPADADGDGDVDLTDFSQFQACFNGPNRPWVATAIQRNCACFDQDLDNDVDLTDFSAFQACFNGPNRPPACP
jgi:hypothetical protein